MKSALSVLTVTLGFILVTVSPARAQFDPCSIEVVLSSFEAAALSNAVELWVQNYETAGCTPQVQRAVQVFARGYQTFFNQTSEGMIPRNWIGTGQGVSNYRGQLSVYLGFYSDVEVSLNTLASGSLEGTIRFDTRSAGAPGSYYFSAADLPEPDLWDIIEGCDTDNVILWLDWVTSEPIEGDLLRGLLAVAVITDDGRMCAASYDSSTGGQKIVDYVFRATN